jgi:hypothetical protein
LPCLFCKINCRTFQQQKVRQQVAAFFPDVTAKGGYLARGEIHLANVSTTCAVPFSKTTSALDAFVTTSGAPLRIYNGRYMKGHPLLNSLRALLIRPKKLPSRHQRNPHAIPLPLIITIDNSRCKHTTTNRIQYTSPSRYQSKIMNTNVIRRQTPDPIWHLYTGSMADVAAVMLIAPHEITLMDGSTECGENTRRLPALPQLSPHTFICPMPPKMPSPYLAYNNKCLHSPCNVHATRYSLPFTNLPRLTYPMSMPQSQGPPRSQLHPVLP